MRDHHLQPANASWERPASLRAAGTGAGQAPAPWGPAPNRENPFANFTTGDRSQRYSYLTPGKYRGRVHRIHRKRSRKGVDLIIIELLLLASCGSDALQTGMVASAYIRLSDLNYGPRDLRAFTAVTLTDRERAIASEYPLDEIAEWIAGDTQPLVGRLVTLVVDRITTRAGQPFDRVTWWPTS